MSYLLRDVAPGLSINARAEASGDGPTVVCVGEKMLIHGDSLPRWSDVEHLVGGPSSELRTLGTFEGAPIRLVVLDSLATLPPELRLERPRNLMFLLADTQAELALALVGQQYGHFVRTHRFCGTCGTRTTSKTGEHASTARRARATSIRTSRRA